MRNIIALIAGLIIAISCVPYILDIIKGKTHPNIVTWITFTLINVINTIAALSSGEPRTAALTAFGGLGSVIIATMAVQRGVKRYTGFDIVCQVLAIIGIILWLFSHNPLIGVVVALVVYVLASLPTWHHAWIAPHAETWQGFAIAGVGSLITLASLSSQTFIALAFPIAFAINSAVFVSVILGRRRATSAVYLASRQTNSSLLDPALRQ